MYTCLLVVSDFIIFLLSTVSFVWSVYWKAHCMCVTFESAFSLIFWWLLVCYLQSERSSGADVTYSQTFKNICKTKREIKSIIYLTFSIKKKEQEQNRWSWSISAANLHFCFGESPKSTQSFPEYTFLWRLFLKSLSQRVFSYSFWVLGLVVHFFPS